MLSTDTEDPDNKKHSASTNQNSWTLKRQNKTKSVLHDSLFTDGICTYNCVCFSGDGTTVIGHDENNEQIIFIDLNERLTRRSCVGPKFEKFEEKCFWLSMACVTFAQTSIYVALIYVKEMNKYFVISFMLNDLIGQEEMILLHEMNIDANMGEFQEGLLASLFQDSNGQIFVIQDMWEEASTVVNLIKVTVDELGCIALENLFEQLKVDGHWYCSCVFDNAIRLINFDNNWTSIFMLILPFNEENSQPRIIYVPCGSEFEFPTAMSVSFVLVYQNQLIYALTSSSEKKTVLIAINVNEKKFEFCFELTEHAVDSVALRKSRDGKLAMNGYCMEQGCKKWHLYHFSIDQTFLPPLDKRNRFFLGMRQLSVIFSKAMVDIIHGGQTTENSVILILKLVQEIENKSATDGFAYIFVGSLGRVDFYSSYLKQLPIDTENVKVVLVDSDDILFSQTSPIFLDNWGILPNKDRITMNSRNSKTVIMMKAEIEFGCDQPREKYFKWYRMPPTTPLEEEISAQEDQEQSKQQSIKEVFSTKKTRQDLTHPLDHFYPDWRTIFQAKKKSQTICCPPCSDVENTLRNKQGVGGREAERLLIDAFLGLDLGGILVTGMNSDEFLKRLKAMPREFVAENIAKDQAELLKVWKEKAFEIDALFIHAHYGIIIFECKKRDVNPGGTITTDDTFIKAVKQLEKVRNGIEILYRAVTKTNLRNDLIHGVAVYPNSVIPDKAKIVSHYNELQVWDRDDVLVAECLRNQMQQFFSESEVQDDLRPLAISLVSYRSIVFISLEHHALEVHKRLDRQMYLKEKGNTASKKVEADAKKGSTANTQISKQSKNKEKTKNMMLSISTEMISNNPETTKMTAKKEKIRLATQATDDSPLFLSSDQLTALESKFKCLIVSGPPGTGKTIVLLLKALVALKTKTTGKVMISSENNNHIPILQNIVELNLKKFDRMPSFYDEPSDDDDYFVDELKLDESQMKLLLQKRQQCNGKTFVAVTGYQSPALIVTIKDWLLRNSLDKFEHISLSKVFRGSKKIVAEWQSYYENKLQISIGHEIIGQSVVKFSCITVDEMMKKLVDEMKPFYLPSFFPEPGTKRKLNHIAVLVAENIWTLIVRSFLAAEGIPCGSAIEQANNPSIVTVDWYVNCLSYEWPIVYVVAFDHLFSDDPFYVLASSRAIARLFIINRDFMATQIAIDEQLNESSANLTQMSYDHFEDIIAAAKKRLNELYSNTALYHNIWLAMIRHNFCPNDLRKYPMFENCTVLAEILKTATGTPFICELFLEQKHFLELLAQMKDDRFILNERVLPKLLAQLWDDEIDAVSAKRWDYLQPIRLLIEFYEKSREDRSKAIYSDQEKELQHLLRKSKMWKTITQSCYTILCSVYDQHR